MKPATRGQKRKRRDVSPIARRKTTTTKRQQLDLEDPESSMAEGILATPESQGEDAFFPFASGFRSPLLEMDSERAAAARAPSSTNRDFALNAGWVLKQHFPDRSPLPKFSWADSDELWREVFAKDFEYKKEEFYIQKNHPGLRPQMRVILLDWLIEVCEVYKLRRETFYLCADYCDRFLAKACSVPKEQLQLIGITSLFIAAKVEEIYPPKLADFAYVTDGACSEKQIEEMELVQLQTLNWMLSPVTVNSWLNVFLQLANMKFMKMPSENFIIPAYSQQDFVKVIQLLDLCIFDLGSLRFPNSVMAASAMCLTLGDDFSWESTGQSWERIHECVQWMQPFYVAIRRGKNGTPNIHSIDTVEEDQRHTIQTHVNSVNLLDDVKFISSQIGTGSRAAAASSQLPTLTPPGSAEKMA
eukprot:m.20344 g.20344  ORF g.20344 m.20344 type:complete len:415 (+) comp28001_c0_seq3:119-1363(+)